MSDFKLINLGKECIIKRGISWSREQETTSTENSIPVLTIPNIKKNLDLTKMKYLLNVKDEIIEKKSIKDGYTIAVGSNGNKKRVGDCCYISEPSKMLFASFLFALTPKENSALNKNYLYYLFKSSLIRNQIQSALIGTTTLSNLSKGYLESLNVKIPSSKLNQQKIASILYAYDKLIKKNTRLIEILEEMAQRIYKECL